MGRDARRAAKISPISIHSVLDEPPAAECRAESIPSRMARTWPVAAAFILVVGVALFFRLYRLDTFLHWAFGDEMSYGIEGQNVVHGIYTGLFPYTWDNAAATYAYLLALFQQIFGATLHTDRMVSVYFGTLTVPLLALCARELEISWTGSLVAAGLLAVSHWHAHFSRMALPATTTAFMLLLAIYCMMVTYRRGHWWLFVISGVVCGAAPYMFLSNRILGPIVGLWALYLLIVDFQWVRQNWWKIAAFAATFVAVLTPLLLFWLHDPGWFMAPEHHVGIMYNVTYWAGQHPGESTAFWNVMLHQIPLALGMFVVNGGPYPPWGGTFAPAMDVLTGWLFFAGALFAFSRWRRPLVALVLIWALLTWFFGVVLTLDAPQMEHAVGMIPAAFLLIAFLLDTAGTALMRKADRPLLYVGLAALLVGVSGVLNYQAYFQTWGSQLAGANGFAWQFYDAAIYVGRHPTPNGTAIYSWGYPDEFFRFLAPQAKEFPGDEKAFRPASLYIVIAGAAVSPQAIAAHVPEARLEAVYDIDGDLAFTAILPPSGTHLTSSLVRAAPSLCQGFTPPAPAPPHARCRASACCSRLGTLLFRQLPSALPGQGVLRRACGECLAAGPCQDVLLAIGRLATVGGCCGRRLSSGRKVNSPRVSTLTILLSHMGRLTVNHPSPALLTLPVRLGPWDSIAGSCPADARA